MDGASGTAGYIRHALYTFGRNFHGQLGSPDFEDRKTPVAVSLGFRPCQVGNAWFMEISAPHVE